MIKSNVFLKFDDNFCKLKIKMRYTQYDNKNGYNGYNCHL